MQQLFKNVRSDNSGKRYSKKAAAETITSGYKHSNVKNILPKVTPSETQTLIIINPATPAFVSSAAVRAPPATQKVILKPKSAKNCKIISKNSKSNVFSDKSSESIREIKWKSKDKSEVCGNIETNVRKKKISKTLAKISRKGKIVEVTLLTDL